MRLQSCNLGGPMRALEWVAPREPKAQLAYIYIAHLSEHLLPLAVWVDEGVGQPALAPSRRGDDALDQRRDLSNRRIGPFEIEIEKEREGGRERTRKREGERERSDTRVCSERVSKLNLREEGREPATTVRWADGSTRDKNVGSVFKQRSTRAPPKSLT